MNLMMIYISFGSWRRPDIYEIKIFANGSTKYFKLRYFVYDVHLNTRICFATFYKSI